MKKLTILIAALFLIAVASSMAMAFTYADEVVVQNSTANGAPNHAPSMNMNWFNSLPCPPFVNTLMYPGEPFINPDRLKAQPDGWSSRMGGPAVLVQFHGQERQMS